MEKLKNCPFCGSDKVILQQVANNDNWTRHFEDGTHIFFAVKCSVCGAKGGVGMMGNNPLIHKTTTEAEAKQIAVSKWNQRKDG